MTMNPEEYRPEVEHEGAEERPRIVAGDCDLCGEWSGHLVEGACPPCRAHYKLS